MDLTDPCDPFCVTRGRRRTPGDWGLEKTSIVHASIAADSAS